MVLQTTEMGEREQYFAYVFSTWREEDDVTKTHGEVQDAIYKSWLEKLEMLRESLGEAQNCTVVGLTATPVGQLNVASEQWPSLLPFAPVPAKVETRPPGATLRTRLLPASATYRLPPASRATWSGRLNWAAVP